MTPLALLFTWLGGVVALFLVAGVFGVINKSNDGPVGFAICLWPLTAIAAMGAGICWLPWRLGKALRAWWLSVKGAAS